MKHIKLIKRDNRWCEHCSAIISCVHGSVIKFYEGSQVISIIFTCHAQSCRCQPQSRKLKSPSWGWSDIWVSLNKGKWQKCIHPRWTLYKTHHYNITFPSTCVPSLRRKVDSVVITPLTPRTPKLLDIHSILHTIMVLTIKAGSYSSFLLELDNYDFTLTLITQLKLLYQRLWLPYWKVSVWII